MRHSSGRSAPRRFVRFFALALSFQKAVFSVQQERKRLLNGQQSQLKTENRTTEN
jgi:hypothetical protein